MTAEEKRKAGRPKKENKVKRVFAGYFDADLMDALKQDAENESRSINFHVIFILKKYLKEKGVM